MQNQKRLSVSARYVVEEISYIPAFQSHDEHASGRDRSFLPSGHVESATNFYFTFPLYPAVVVPNDGPLTISELYKESEWLAGLVQSVPSGSPYECPLLPDWNYRHELYRALFLTTRRLRRGLELLRPKLPSIGADLRTYHGVVAGTYVEIVADMGFNLLIWARGTPFCHPDEASATGEAELRLANRVADECFRAEDKGRRQPKPYPSYSVSGMIRHLRHEYENTRSNETDGPVGLDSFRWHGTVHGGLTAKRFRLLTALWTAKDRTLHFEQLADPVWGDRNEPVSSTSVDSLCRELRTFFRSKNIPLAANRSGQIVSLKSTAKE